MRLGEVLHKISTTPKVEKKSKQISFRVEPSFANELEAIATKEEIPAADLMRKFLRLAAAEYQRAGSLHELRMQFGGEEGTEVLGVIDKESYRKELRKQVLTKSVELAEKGSRDKGQRPRSKPADE